jgi:hypothetical protein
MKKLLLIVCAALLVGCNPNPNPPEPKRTYYPITSPEWWLGCSIWLIDNHGSDFQTAIDSLAPSIQIARECCFYDFSPKPSFTAESVDDVQVRYDRITVIEVPNPSATFNMICFYMYNTVYEDYIMVRDFGVVDSDGNYYGVRTPPD